jgi:Sulfotransferase domain
VPTSVRIDFIVPGFSKCGTTTLCALLDLHPDIFIPAEKEPWYFSRENFDTYHAYYDWLYETAANSQLKGDGSTDYTGYLKEDIAIQRIYDNNPDCRFIFIARNPKARIESSYREMHHSGATFGLDAPYELSECLQVFPQMIQDTLFWKRIVKYREAFGDAAILVIFLEDLKSDQGRILDQCFTHLGLDANKYPQGASINLNAGETKLYDTRAFRFLRKNRFTGMKLAKIAPPTQDRIFGPLGLRRTFGKKPLVWDSQSSEIFQREVVPDSLQFLEFYGKSATFWGMNEAVQKQY